MYLFCCSLEKKFSVALFMKRTQLFRQCREVRQHKYDLFLIYNQDSSDDNILVDEDIIPLLKQHNFIFATEEDCFPAG